MLNFENNLLNFVTVLGWREFKGLQRTFWITLRIEKVFNHFSKYFWKCSWRENQQKFAKSIM